MRIWSRTGQPGEPVPAHSNEVFAVHERVLGTSAARSRYIDGRSGRRVHVIEAGEGEGPPVVLLHGSSTSSLSFLPLLDHLQGVRAFAADRPGFGLSDPVQVPRERFRDAAIAFVDGVVDELGLETCAVAGGSMGGTWALWYALAHPERVDRLVLLTGAPLLPGTRVPAPVRVMATPIIGDLLARLVEPNAKMVVRLMSSMGEKDTIVRHTEVAQATAGLVSQAQLEVLPAGHVPWLGHPERVAELLSEFVNRVAGSD